MKMPTLEKYKGNVESNLRSTVMSASYNLEGKRVEDWYLCVARHIGTFDDDYWLKGESGRMPSTDEQREKIIGAIKRILEGCESHGVVDDFLDRVEPGLKNCPRCDCQVCVPPGQDDDAQEEKSEESTKPALKPKGSKSKVARLLKP